MIEIMIIVKAYSIVNAGDLDPRGMRILATTLLSDDQVDPSDVDNSALIRASCAGHLEVVRLLLTDDRVDPSA